MRLPGNRTCEPYLRIGSSGWLGIGPSDHALRFGSGWLGIGLCDHELRVGNGRLGIGPW